MRIILISVLAVATAAPLTFAQTQEEAEPYLVAPYTLSKTATVTFADFTTMRGKVVGGDEDKIVMLQPDGKRVEVQTSKIHLVQFRRPRRSNKLDFLGSLIGGIGFGYGGAAVGKHAAMSIRSDGTPGRLGPIAGGVSFGFLGGYIGKRLIRHAVTEQVTLTLVPQGAPGSPAALKPTPAKATKANRQE